MKLENAIRLAALRHEGQLDKADEPYIRHPLRVMEVVAPWEDAMVVAVLHDVEEDTGRLDPLDREALSPLQRGALFLLTRDGEPYAEYIDNICREANVAQTRPGQLAREVKIADVRDNLSRLDALSQEDADRLRKRYEPTLWKLMGREAKVSA